MKTGSVAKPDLISIGAAAMVTGMTTHSIRVYEREGLILCHRTDSGRRLLSRVEIERIGSIRRLIRKEKLNFAAIRRLLALVPCWEILGRSRKDCENCPALYESRTPCWHMGQACPHNQNPCIRCPVYSNVTDLDTLKSRYFRSTVGNSSRTGDLPGSSPRIQNIINTILRQSEV